MTHIVNTEQATAWNGPEGAHWAEQRGSDDAVNVELTRALLTAAEIGPVDQVVDVGCGTGDSSREAARLAAQGRVLGIDLSAVMLEHARAATTAAGLSNVAFVQADAQVHPFAAGQFDVAISQFGIMFFTEPVAGFGNIGRALRPGGRIAFLCPRDMAANAWYVAPLSALQTRLGSGSLPDSQMFSLADPAHLTEVLTGAGFVDVRPQPLDVPMEFGASADVAAEFYLGSGPVRSVLERNPEFAAELARDILVQALRPYESPDGVRIPGANWLVTAVRP
ncbi:methyltransferase domain-containing protein [Plantactinospora sp. S1510]|uniref:Methyltransferase domain-containing protein n=1 Tax=Plantactinospora alkalitolerans TaxID=2789879 RepID=A0ABS0GWI2_9ACTN|nr:class I SAM-dependent methyltransferase [Plantactinospora alkalitolerans]MBF9130567.1 methyltransferase domain-containing protein [Plantactinospora alkalitolerans]